MVQRILTQKKHGLIGALIGMIVFMFLPSSIDTAWSMMAPENYYLTVTSIEATDINLASTTLQKMTTHRYARNSIVDVVAHYELMLVNDTGRDVLMGKAQNPDEIVYEKGTKSVEWILDVRWISDDDFAKLVPGEYYWVTTIEYSLENGVKRTPKTVVSNHFYLSPGE